MKQPSKPQLTSRRNFIARAALAAGAIPALHILGNSSFTEDAAAQAKPTVPVDTESPLAKALGYVHDHTKADTTKFPTAKTAIASGSACSKCTLLTEKGLKADGQTGSWGRCSLFPTGLVNENGWCMSFAAKA